MKPLVSVCVITYQQKNFIRRCLQSIVNQDTDFRFELIIGDDGSTDGTSDICRDFQRTYPDLVKLTIYKRTHYAENPAWPPGKYNLAQTLSKVSGKYVALCEGDDYWLDNSKLQQQVNFLEQNSDFSLCFHSVYIDSGDGLVKDSITLPPLGSESNLLDLASGNYIHTPSVVYRNIFTEHFPDFFYLSPVSDYLLHIFAAEKGKIKYFDKKWAAYRVHEESYWSSKSSVDRLRLWMDVLAPLVGYFNNTPDVSAAFKEQLFGVGSHLLGEYSSSNDHQSELKNVISILTDIDVLKLTSSLNNNNAYRQPHKIALFTQKQTGLRLTAIVQAILDNRKSSFSTGVDKKAFVVDTARQAYEQVRKDIERVSGTALSGELLELIQSALQLLSPHFIDQLDDRVLALKNEIISWKERQDYRRWVDNHALMEIDAQLHAERLSVWSSQPSFHLVMFLFDGEGALLANTIDSLSRQLYGNWKLTVIADGEALDPMFDELDVLEWISFPSEAEPYPFVNQFVEDSPADWIAFIPAGTQFVPQALLVFGDYINVYPKQRLFYSDDDQISETGERHSPRFKPDFNLDLLRSSDYIGVVMCQKALWTEADGIGIYPGYENMGLAFSTYEQIGQVGIGHISDVLVHLPESTSEKQNQAILQQVVTDHLARADCDALVSQGLLTGTIRVQYQHPSTPLVSIIIPTKDKLEFLHPCVESLLSKTGYSNYEVIIVDNQSSDPDVLIYLSELPESSGGKVRVIKYPHPFNYAAISNCAAKEANGEYLLFLNNDTEILHSEWLERMVNHAQRGDVGIVGARLVYPETGLLQHAGVIMGMGRIASHIYVQQLHLSEKGYMSRLQVDQDFSAVTGACLLIDKQVYESVGGMNEENLAVLYNDIDLCLKVNKTGRRVVWTPYATLLHHSNVSLSDGGNHRESDQAERAEQERAFMLKTWLPEISNDPAYNRNFSLAFSDYRIEHQMPCNWDVNFHDRARVLGFPLSGGSGDYRVIDPFNALSQAGIAQCESYRFPHGSARNIATFTEIARMDPDTVVFHASLGNVMLQLIEDVEEFLPATCKIFTLDDLLTDVPEESSAYKNIQRSLKDAKPRIRRALAHCDRLIVTTEPLAELCGDMIDDIRVIPNRLRSDPWCNLRSLRQQGHKPRVGWAGAQQHQGDLKVIVDVVKETAEEIDWIFMGMCPDELKPFVKENHDYVSIKEYPAKLASLNLDLAIAPLEQHPFNESKSNLRLLEYGILGWPVICTDIYPYSSYDAPVVRVNNNKDEWLEAIRSALKSPESLQQAGDAMRQWVLDYFILEDHLDEWKEALTSFSPSKQQSVLLKH